MSATALQLPAVGASAQHVGGRLFRKQILPGSVVDHPQRGRVELDLAGIVERFEAGAMDVVPFTLVDAANRHTDDIDQVRGTVKRLEREGDQLYAVIEATDRGAALISEQPRLPVSVRVKVPESGPHAGQQVLGHVAGTLDPVVTGMRAWEPVEAANGVLLDFSAGEFTSETTSSDDVLSEAVQELITKALGDDPVEFASESQLSARETAESIAAAWEGTPRRTVELSHEPAATRQIREFAETWLGVPSTERTRAQQLAERI